MKIAGLLIIIIALSLTALWVCTDHAHKGWAVTVCILALFAGMFLVVQHRAIEVTFKSLGKIKAAVQQVSGDAAAVASLKQRVEAHSATVDLVAKSAEEARKLVDELTERSYAAEEKLGQLDEATQDAEAGLVDMRRATEAATVFLAAQNDDWSAFDQLRKWGEDEACPLRKVASNAYVKIRLSYASPVGPGYLNITWPPGVDPSELCYGGFMKAYTDLPPVLHAHLVHVVWGRSDISQRERMHFLVEVLNTSNSLTARHYAAKYFVQATGDKELKWEPFGIDSLLRWWDENSQSIT